MKKTYVTPKSELFILQLSENIAASGGGDEITGQYRIRFTQAADGCRGIYSGNPAAPVTVGDNASPYAYYMEALRYSLGLVGGVVVNLDGCLF